MSFSVRRRVEFCDTDMAGIVHFANFYRFMEYAEQAFLRSQGLSVIFSEGNQQFGFPRVAATCDFLAPAIFEDLLDIEVNVQRVGSKSVTYEFHIRRGRDSIARGTMTSVCCRHTEAGLESVIIPDSYRKKLLGEDSTPAGEFVA